MSGKKIMKHSGKKHIAPAILNAVGLPPDSCGTLAYITLTGQEYAVIEHHCGVLRLTPECIRLYSATGIIRITGERLQASEMDNERISLRGCIKTVEFE